jgi:hypothetical protein
MPLGQRAAGPRHPAGAIHFGQSLTGHTNRPASQEITTGRTPEGHGK